jgi:hypothetical protein
VLPRQGTRVGRDPLEPDRSEGPQREQTNDWDRELAEEIARRAREDEVSRRLVTAPPFRSRSASDHKIKIEFAVQCPMPPVSFETMPSAQSAFSRFNSPSIEIGPAPPMERATRPAR